MKKIVIAFDGPDNVGKGTQINLLRKRYQDIPFLLLNVDPPIGENHAEKISYGREHIKRTLDAVRKLPHPQIHDRFHFTEYAYSMFRGGHDLNDVISIEKEYDDVHSNLLVITFVDEPEKIHERDDGNSAYDAEKLDTVAELIQRFHEMSHHSHFDNHIIHIGGKDIPTVHEEVINHIESKFPHLVG